MFLKRKRCSKVNNAPYLFRFSGDPTAKNGFLLSISKNTLGHKKPKKKAEFLTAICVDVSGSMINRLGNSADQLISAVFESLDPSVSNSVLVYCFSEAFSQQRLSLEGCWATKFAVPPTFSNEDLLNSFYNALKTMRRKCLMFPKSHLIDKETGVLCCEADASSPKEGRDFQSLCSGGTDPDDLFRKLQKLENHFPETAHNFLFTDAEMDVTSQNPLAGFRPTVPLYVIFDSVLEYAETFRKLPLTPQDPEKQSDSFYHVGFSKGTVQEWAAAKFGDRVCVSVSSSTHLLRFSGSGKGADNNASLMASLPILVIGTRGSNSQPEDHVDIQIDGSNFSVPVPPVSQTPRAFSDVQVRDIATRRYLQSVAANVTFEKFTELMEICPERSFPEELMQVLACVQSVGISKAAAMFSPEPLPEHLVSMFRKSMAKAQEELLQLAREKERDKEREQQIRLEKEQQKQREARAALEDVLRADDPLTAAMNKLATASVQLDQLRTEHTGAEAELWRLEDLKEEARKVLMGDPSANLKAFTPEQVQMIQGYRPQGSELPSSLDAPLQVNHRGTRYRRRKPNKWQSALAQVESSLLDGPRQSLQRMEAETVLLQKICTHMQEFIDSGCQAREGAQDEDAAQEAKDGDAFDLSRLSDVIFEIVSETAYFDARECMICMGVADPSSPAPIQACVNPKCTGRMCLQCTTKIRETESGCPFCRESLLSQTHLL